MHAVACLLRLVIDNWPVFIFCFRQGVSFGIVLNNTLPPSYFFDGTMFGGIALYVRLTAFYRRVE